MPSIPFHPPGVTYNGLHSTPNPTVTLVTADRPRRTSTLATCGPTTHNTAYHFGLIDYTGKSKGILF